MGCVTRRLFPRYESPAGRAIETPVRTGVPGLGVPSEFQPTFCALVVRVVPQPWLVDEFAW
jgi:hypothetical protein